MLLLGIALTLLVMPLGAVLTVDPEAAPLLRRVAIGHGYKAPPGKRQSAGRRGGQHRPDPLMVLDGQAYVCGDVDWGDHQGALVDALVDTTMEMRRQLIRAMLAKSRFGKARAMMRAAMLYDGQSKLVQCSPIEVRRAALERVGPSPMMRHRRH